MGYEGLNGVFIAPGTAAVPVEDAQRTFQRFGVPALWHIGEAAGQVPGREADPIAHCPGFSFYEEEPLMSTTVGRYELPHVDGLSILPVHGAAGIRDWVRIWSGRPVVSTSDTTVRARLGAAPAFVHLLAVLRGEAVGCAAAFVGLPSGSEVQHVVTVPGVRGRGIGTALTVAALRSIAARGAGTAVLTASPDGLGIYRRLGFRTVGAVRRYLWSPEESQKATVITRPDGPRNIAVPSSDVGVQGGYPAQAWVRRPAMPS